MSLISKDDFDNLIIAELNDSNLLFETYLNKIQQNIRKLQNADPSDKNKLGGLITGDFKSSTAVLDTMSIEVSSLKSKKNEEKFRTLLKLQRAKLKQMQDSFKGLTDHKDVVIKSQNEGNTIIEMMNKGDNILNDGDRAIDNMTKKINNAKDISNNIKNDLHNQLELLEKTNNHLEEIDLSIGRANKKIKNMFRLLATDKLIMALIVIIILIIIAVVIFSIITKKPVGGYNQLNDPFTNKSFSKTTK